MKKKIIDWLMTSPKALKWYVRITARRTARDFCKTMGFK